MGGRGFTGRHPRRVFYCVQETSNLSEPGIEPTLSSSSYSVADGYTTRPFDLSY